MSTKDIFIETLEARIKELRAGAANLVDAVERYARQECLRSELLNTKNALKKLLK